MSPESIRFKSEMIFTAEFIRKLKSADVVLTEPTSPEWNSQIAFGTRVLRRIETTGKAENLQVLRLIVNWGSQEPDALCAALILTKGSCEFLSGGLTS